MSGFLIAGLLASIVPVNIIYNLLKKYFHRHFICPNCSTNNFQYYEVLIHETNLTTGKALMVNQCRTCNYTRKQAEVVIPKIVEIPNNVRDNGFSGGDGGFGGGAGGGCSGGGGHC